MTTGEPKRFRDLLNLLEGMRAMHADMVALAADKLEAMRRADLAAMSHCAEREQTLSRRMTEREGLRKQLMDAVATELGIAGKGRALTVSQLAALLAEPAREEWLAVAGKLRETVLRLSRVNLLVGVAAREIVNHMKWVFAAVRPRPSARQGYAQRGSPVSGETELILEIVA